MELPHFSDLLKEEYDARKKQNPAFSLRSYARKINVSPTTLTHILNKRSGLSLNRAKEIAKKLNWNSTESAYFVTLVEMCCSRNERKRELARIRLRRFDHHKNQVSLDSYKIISEWYHFAIVELTYLKAFQPEAQWIAEQLEITHVEAENAIERLIRIGLLEKTDSTLKASKSFYFVPSGVPSEAARKTQIELMEKAKNVLNVHGMDERYVGSSIIHFNQSRFKELQKKLQDFRRELTAWAESGSEFDSVYSISFQSIRLTKDST